MLTGDGPGHPNPSFALSVSDERGRHIVAASGEIDLATASELSDALVRSVVAGSGDVVVDLSAVTFMDSTGLGALVQSRKRLAGLGRKLILRRPSQRVSRVLEVSGLSDAFAIED